MILSLWIETRPVLLGPWLCFPRCASAIFRTPSWPLPCPRVAVPSVATNSSLCRTETAVNLIQLLVSTHPTAVLGAMTSLRTGPVDPQNLVVSVTSQTVHILQGAYGQGRFNAGALDTSELQFSFCVLCLDKISFTKLFPLLRSLIFAGFLCRCCPSRG